MSWPVRLLLIVVVLLATPGAANAATPFTAGSGEEAAVSVGSDGTGHVVWVTASDNDQVGYCRIGAGAESCNRTELLNFAGSTSADNAGRAHVFTPAPGKVVIVAGCWDCPDGIQDRTYRWISLDNGSTFGAATEIGSGIETAGFGLWLDDLNIFVAASGSRAKAATAGGEGIQYATGGLFVYGPEIARVPASNKLVAATNDLEVVKYGVYSGPGSVAGINNVVGWTIDQTLPSPEPDNSDTALNSGPNGVFLTYRYFVAGDTRVGLRRFDPAVGPAGAFGGATYVEGGNEIENNSLDYPDSFQDASGRIHVTWRSLYDGGRLRYSVSDTTGANFSPAANLAKSENFHEPEIAAGPDGRGFAAWTAGTTGAVRVVPLDPTPEPLASGTDTTRPGVSDATIGDRTLLPGQATTFRFNASEAGLAVLTFEKRFKKGVKVRKKAKGKKAKLTCLPATKKRLRALRKQVNTKKAYRKLLKKRACKGWQRVGQIRQRVRAGANSIPFDGRIAGRKLAKGQYRGRLVITDAAGLASRTETIKFKVVAKKAKKKPARRR
ncbi:MAG TPA: hypothetical protein VEW67_06350 [Thermoleophilaceae bacterium]|nr:hypothetical protein [Thermoleophilaceae bacterium]